MKKGIILFGLLFLVASTSLLAQNHQLPFWEEIETFKKGDSLHFPAPAQILFIGSSSFRMWKNIHSAFPEHAIINRGFGGSSLPDVTTYANDLIFPYKPKQIVIYCGENDIAAADTVSGKMVYERFKTLFCLIRQRAPEVPVVYVSMKPSPSRWQMKNRMIEGNELIRNYLKKQKAVKFVTVWRPKLGKDGKPDESLFESDNLHMNEKGYAIWKKLIQPHLIQ